VKSDMVCFEEGRDSKDVRRTSGIETYNGRLYAMAVRVKGALLACG
jgi:hypothetical protein